MSFVLNEMLANRIRYIDEEKQKWLNYFSANNLLAEKEAHSVPEKHDDGSKISSGTWKK